MNSRENHLFFTELGQVNHSNLYGTAWGKTSEHLLDKIKKFNIETRELGSNN